MYRINGSPTHPMAPMKSASTESAPMQSPPKAAAVGMYLLSSWIMDVSLWPLITIYNTTMLNLQLQSSILSRLLTCCSLSCLATSLAELPDTSIQVLLKNAQLPNMNEM